MNKSIHTSAGDVPAKRFYHGTRAVLKPGELISPDKPLDIGGRGKKTPYVFLTPDLDGAIWEAELAEGDGPGRVYVVEPLGPIEHAGDLTDQKAPGHPTMSYCSRRPLRVTGEVTDWQGHAPETVKAMKDGLKRLEQLGVEPNDE